MKTIIATATSTNTGMATLRIRCFPSRFSWRLARRSSFDSFFTVPRSFLTILSSLTTHKPTDHQPLHTCLHTLWCALNSTNPWSRTHGFCGLGTRPAHHSFPDNCLRVRARVCDRDTYTRVQVSSPVVRDIVPRRLGTRPIAKRH